MNGKDVLVLGAARSGICSAGLLLRNHATVTVYDQNTKIDRDTFYSNFDPEKYPDLIVRVAGYSAIFVNLSRDIQNELLSRTLYD